VLRSYYFAISNLVVGGRCKCNGHASECIETVTNDGKSKLKCKCEHNTDGDDCQKCLPLFNDTPWKRATRFSANPCSPCNCNGLADSCIFDRQLYQTTGRGGRCVACKNNTDGVNCERCKIYHYRREKNEACKPCNCDSIGSRRPQCNSDGQCSCHPGVYGAKCDKCRPGYFGFSKTGCRPCKCSKRGSLSEKCDVSGKCQCKKNVKGLKCDQCIDGHFNLDEKTADGCKACFCYGHGVSCQSRLGFERHLIKSDFTNGLQGWKVENYQGVDFQSAADFDLQGKNVRITAQNSGEALYLVAPRQYLGDRLGSYARKLTFVLGVTELQQGWDDIKKDFILEGAGLKAEFPITAQGNGVPKPRFEEYTFILKEPKGMSVFDFQKLLNDLTAIKIRVTYGRVIGVIDSISMEATKPASINSLQQVDWEEQCRCKKGYTGIQCEKCDSGYTRENAKEGKYGKCVLCNCNNHARECHPETGVCKCQDNTTGKNCEKCKPGFYGYATEGRKDDCKPCPCVFGSQCIYLAGKVHCTDCPKGHEGDLCERCKDGYFGDPEGKNGRRTGCKPCNCNDNIDKNAIGNCDRMTGECLKCIYNTKNGPMGKCEMCKTGYYGDALALPKGQCKPCNCFVNGTVWPPGVDPTKDLLPCDQNGQCQCRDYVIGKNCSACPPTYWNVASGRGCEKCRCNAIGSVDRFCDLESGQCNCKQGVAGRQCGLCAAGHYQFSKSGCKACNCNKFGSIDANCTQYGVCTCKPGVLGVKCDQCPQNRYNLSVGCIACPQCFFLVQRKVHELKEKLIRLKASVGEAILPKNFTIRSKNFSVALLKIEGEAKHLEDKIKTLQLEEKNLKAFFKKLMDDFEALKRNLKRLEDVYRMAFNHSRKADTDIGDGEEIIEQIKLLLQDAVYQLDEHGAMAYREALKLAKDISDLAKQMKKIAAEAKAIADKHEEQAKKIKDTAKMAHDMSKSAYEIGKKARMEQEDMLEKLNKMTVNTEKAIQLAIAVSKKVMKAKNTTEDTLKEAKKVYDEALKPIAESGIALIREKVKNITSVAMEISNTSTTLLESNKDLIKKYHANEKEARELMRGGRKEYMMANETFKMAQMAYDKAKKAKESADNTAKDALEVLRLLTGFNEEIEKSKKNFTDAKKYIPIIKSLIKSANESAIEGKSFVDMSSKTTNAAQAVFKDANELLTSNKQMMSMMKKNATDDEALLEKLKKEVENVVKDMNTSEKILQNYKKLAERDGIAVKNALAESKQAQSDAKKAEADLNKALDDVEKLLKDLLGMGTLNITKLENAEKRFKTANDTIVGRLDVELERLKKNSVLQSNQIKQYELDLGPLEKEIKHVEDIYKSLPRQCMKPAPPPA